MEKAEAIARINAINASRNPLLKDVGNLMLDLDLELIACCEEIRRDGDLIGEIDLLFKIQEAEKALLIEVSTRSTNISEKISNFFSKWGCEDNETLVRNRFTIGQTVEVIRIFFELSGSKEVSASVSHFTNQRGNHIFLQYDLKYFTDAFGKIGKWSKNDLFSFLKIKPREERTIAKDGIQFYLGNICAYAYIDRVDQLLRYCYIFRRIKDDKGYQRVLEKGRISNIALKIQSSNFLAFPSAILISCPDAIHLCDTPKVQADCPGLVKVRIPDYFCACRVIDGQHRLLGFSNLVKSIQENHFLPVIALENIGQLDEMKTFIDINSTQKKIDRNLILVLEADFDWEKAVNKKEYFEKVAVSVIKKLNENSSLRNKIYIPDALAKRKGKITLATLVSAVLGNNFIGGRKHIFQENDEDEKTPFEEIKNIFSLLRKHIPNYSTDVGSFFLSNKGLRILFRMIQIYERNRLKSNIDFNRESLIADLRRIVNDELVKKLEDYYGEGGASNAVMEMFSLLKKAKRKKYKNFETDLKNI